MKTLIFPSNKQAAADYAEAAAERGLLPREMQSITWEEVRTIFTPEFKNSNANQLAVNDIWRQHKNGTLTLSETRSKIEEFANVKEGRKPSWAIRSDTGNAQASPTSTYREELSGDGLPGSGSGGVDAGRGGNAASKRGTGAGGVNPPAKPGAKERPAKPAYQMDQAEYDSKKVVPLDKDASSIGKRGIGDSEFAKEVKRHKDGMKGAPEYVDFVVSSLEQRLNERSAGSAAADLLALEVAGGKVPKKLVRKATDIINKEIRDSKISALAMEAAFLTDQIATNAGKSFSERRLQQKDYEKLYKLMDELRDLKASEGVEQ